METIQVTNVNGEYNCDINISVDEWVEILRDPELTTPQRWKVLLCFDSQPAHTSNCSDIAQKLKMPPYSVNPYIRHWGEAIQKKLNRFEVIGSDGSITYAAILTISRETKKGSISWTIRPELVEAIKIVLFQQVLDLYKKELNPPNSEYWAGEKYKWEAIQHFQDHWDIDASDFGAMFKEATEKASNLLNVGQAYPRGIISELANYNPQRVRDMFRNLFNNELDFSERMNSFINEAKLFYDEYKEVKGINKKLVCFQDTNAVSTYLWLKYPDKYYKYKYTIYRDTCNFLHLNNDFAIKSDGKVESVLEGVKMYDKIREDLQKDTELVNIINSLLHKDTTALYQDPEFRTATIDFGYFIHEKLKPLFNSEPQIEIDLEEPDMKEKPYQDYVDLLATEKNIILQGAPGTGKTYSTAAIALGILGVKDVDFSKHSEVIKRYKELTNNQIFFTTFHQSMDYEDFVEGLKPNIERDDNGKAIGVIYDTKNGIFKEACKAAEGAQSNKFESWFDDYLTKINGEENKKTVTTQRGKTIYVWRESDNKTINVQSTNSTATYVPSRLNIEKIKAQAQNVGFENNWTHYAKAIINDVNKLYGTPRPVVLIIDEINRGNISKIFGELITLLEADKRKGGDHPVTVTLPYSQDPFEVPSNLYIIGTMNTTDRTTGTIDYAVRRRFAFVTLKADREVIQSDTAKQLFDDVKSFIKTYRIDDTAVEDLMVGHSYFMAEDDQLKAKMEYKVIPLLKEYINDGILQRKPDEQEKYFKSWLELKPYTKQETAKESDTSEVEASNSEGEVE